MLKFIKGKIGKAVLREEKILHYVQEGNLKKLDQYVAGNNYDINETSDVYSCVCDHHKKDHFTVMQYCASHGDPKVLLFLERCQASINKPTASGQTPLILAVLHGNIDNARNLIMMKCDANANDTTYDENTALHYACRYGKSDIFNMLVELKVDVNVKNRFGKTPLDLAKESKHEEIVAVLENIQKESDGSNQVQIREELCLLKETVNERLAKIEHQLTQTFDASTRGIFNSKPQGVYDQQNQSHQPKSAKTPTQNPDSRCASDAESSMETARDIQESINKLTNNLLGESMHFMDDNMYGERKAGDGNTRQNSREDLLGSAVSTGDVQENLGHHQHQPTVYAGFTPQIADYRYLTNFPKVGIQPPHPSYQMAQGLPPQPGYHSGPPGFAKRKSYSVCELNRNFEMFSTRPQQQGNVKVTGDETQHNY